jgi:tetratricopeptide (TPR) repeat protein
MRPVTIALSVLASIATILMYLHLDPPWIEKYLPHLTMPTGESPSQTPQETSPSTAATRDTSSNAAPNKTFAQQYAAGFAQARRHDFSMAVEYYKDAVAAADASGEERAKAYDALGYAYLRMGDYDGADQALSQALKLDPGALVPRINQVKVMCGRHDDSLSVNAALDTLRSLETGNASVTRDIEKDKELFQKCAYAGVTSRWPQRTPP